LEAYFANQDFDYVKGNGEDLVLNKDGHEDMVTKVIIIKPPILAGSEPKNKSTHKFITAGYRYIFQRKMKKLTFGKIERMGI